MNGIIVLCTDRRFHVQLLYATFILLIIEAKNVNLPKHVIYAALQALFPFGNAKVFHQRDSVVLRV